MQESFPVGSNKATNIFGTNNLSSLSIKYDVEKIRTLVSTDERSNVTTHGSGAHKTLGRNFDSIFKL